MKGLPYFKFTSDNWLTGDIYFEPFDIQGLFISVCSIYWSKQDVTLQSLKLRLPTATEEQWKRLQDGGYISFKNGNLVIKFLDEQVSELSEQHQKKVEAGRKGGHASVKQRLSNAKATRKHKDKEEDKEEDKDTSSEVLDFKSDDFKRAWNAWIEYKKSQHKFEYKSKKSEQIALNELQQFDYEFARELIKTAISNGWKGFVFEGTNAAYDTWKASKGIVKIKMNT